MAWRGTFRPKHPEKYAGDPTGIIYRSRIELKYMEYFDRHEDILQWASEELAIEYLKPTDLRIHKYYPDMIVLRRGVDGKNKTFMVELKHSSDLTPPKPPATTRGQRRFLGEMQTWNVNQSKWAAARAYCADRGWEFVVWSEKQLGKAY